MKTAVLGLGKYLTNILKLYNLSNIKLVALCDKDENSYNQIKKIKQLNGVRFYNKFENLLKKEELDLLIILTPSGLHADQISKDLNL